MPDHPRITVVIPTYNRPELVRLAVASVLAQTYAPAEIIVVDDGSTREVAPAMEDFGDRIRLIRQANTGLSGARNTGIQAATTDWVAFLDDDDEYANDRLERAAESIRRFPTADVHVTNTTIVPISGPEIDLFAIRSRPRDPWMHIDRPLTWVLRGCFFAQSLVVRKELLHSVGMFRKTYYEDMDMYVRLAPHAPWIIDGKPGLRLIRRDNTAAMSDAWRAKPLARCEALVRIHREALSLANLNAEERRAACTGLGTYLFELGAAHAAAGDRAAARAALNEAARTFPALHSRLKARAAALGGRPVFTLLQTWSRHRKGVVR